MNDKQLLTLVTAILRAGAIAWNGDSPLGYHPGTSEAKKLVADVEAEFPPISAPPDEIMTANEVLARQERMQEAVASGAYVLLSRAEARADLAEAKVKELESVRSEYVLSLKREAALRDRVKNLELALEKAHKEREANNG